MSANCFRPVFGKLLFKSNLLQLQVTTLAASDPLPEPCPWTPLGDFRPPLPNGNFWRRLVVYNSGNRLEKLSTVYFRFPYVRCCLRSSGRRLVSLRLETATGRYRDVAKDGAQRGRLCTACPEHCRGGSRRSARRGTARHSFDADLHAC